MEFLSAYYFRAHMYTIVPRQVREDMAWMAGIGTDAVVIGILEQDLRAAVENIAIIAGEAERAGLALYATPARWGSLVAGCPKVPSIFTSGRPETWSLGEDGVPWQSYGPIASVHHPETFEFFARSLERLFSLAPIRGIIWDEPKALRQRDFSPAARRALAGRDIEAEQTHTDAQAEFFDRVSAEARRMKPDLEVAMFIYGHLKGYPLERCARIGNLTTFGLDGRPWRASDGGGSDSGRAPAVKFLCDHAPAFIAEAHRNGKRAFTLIENHALATEDIDLMDRRLPEVLALGAEHVCYYYYPRSVAEPDRAMAVLGARLAETARSRGKR